MHMHNQKVLSKLLAAGAVVKARRAPLPPPQGSVMEALREAIDGKRGELQALLVAGKLDTEAYRTAKAQVTRWTAAWNANR